MPGRVHGARCESRAAAEPVERPVERAVERSSSRFFKPKPSLLIKDAAGQRGIHCRFGMDGVRPSGRDKAVARP